MRLRVRTKTLFGSLRTPAAHIYGPETQHVVYIFMRAGLLTGPPVDFADGTGVREKAFIKASLIDGLLSAAISLLQGYNKIVKRVFHCS